MIQLAANPAEDASGGPEMEDQSEKRSIWSPANCAAEEHRELLREVAALIADGMATRDAAEAVGIDIRGQKLPGRFPYVPSPETITAGCLDVQATWDANERSRRNMLPVERWEIVEASAAPVSTERSDYCGLLR